MIEGLKITLPGLEVQRLMRARAAHHEKRREDYRKTYETLSAAMSGMNREQAPKLSSMNNDPVEQAKQGIERHEAKQCEFTYLAKFVDLTETFLLDTADLHQLGVIESRY